ncbi:hypothetical protein BJ508DRAFT_315878 [Ascobolus immersus RN42]|uniref:Uncharacterized protein n=1 Tax=Ascobolus immersus RN42 TaxID=1160509 RepID=A0A3N4H8S9_ASCIM|nr:hypothetical protein BJ508DRAFT_315878 [Ascobolus immersus RN42]
MYQQAPCLVQRTGDASPFGTRAALSLQQKQPQYHTATLKVRKHYNALQKVASRSRPLRQKPTAQCQMHNEPPGIKSFDFVVSLRSAQESTRLPDRDDRDTRPGTFVQRGLEIEIQQFRDDDGFSYPCWESEMGLQGTFDGSRLRTQLEWVTKESNWRHQQSQHHHDMTDNRSKDTRQQMSETLNRPYIDKELQNR